MHGELTGHVVAFREYVPSWRAERNEAKSADLILQKERGAVAVS